MHNHFYYTIFRGKRKWKSGELFHINLILSLRLFTWSIFIFTSLKNYQHCIRRNVVKNVYYFLGRAYFIRRVFFLRRIYFLYYNVNLISQLFVSLNFSRNFFNSIDNSGVILLSKDLCNTDQGSISQLST